MKINLLSQLSTTKKKIIVVIFLVLGFLTFTLILVNAVKLRQFLTLMVLCYLILPAYVMVVLSLFYNQFVLVCLSLAFSVSAISSTLLAQIEPKVNFFAYCLLLPCFFFLTIASLIYLWRYHKENGWLAGLPLGILISSVVIAVALVSILKPLDFYFLWRREEYGEVISLIQNDKIKIGTYGMTTLPEEYQYLSDNSMVEARQKNGVWSIFFYKSAGVLVAGSGYLYRSDNAPPDGTDSCRDWHYLHYSNWIYCGAH